MNKNEYDLKRKDLMNIANIAIGKSDSKKADEIVKKIEKLDDDFNVIAVAKANLYATNNTSRVYSLDDQAVGTLGSMTMNGGTNGMVKYEDVFAKVMMGQEIDHMEAVEYKRMNNVSYAHTASKYDMLIPDTVAKGIIGLVEEQHAFFGDVRKMNVKGKLTFNKHTGITAGDASFVDEGAPAVDEENTFTEVTLDGFEMAKKVNVSFKLEVMSVPDFLAYIQTEIAERIGAVLGQKIFTGTGTKEPKGLFLELAGTEQTIETAAKNKITYKDITAMRGLINSQFSKELKYYAKSTTIWNQLANILDTTGNPIFIANASETGVGSIFGIEVAEDDGVPENELVLGNPNAGMIANINEPLKIESQRELKNRQTLYQGYTIIDWTVTQIKAFAYLKVRTI